MDLALTRVMCVDILMQARNGMGSRMAAASSLRAVSASAPARQLNAESFLSGTSSVYVEEMYRAWKTNPARLVLFTCGVVFVDTSAHVSH